MAEPISLTIGGKSHWGIAIVDNEADADTKDDVAISNDVELKFHGKTILDSENQAILRTTLVILRSPDPRSSPRQSESGLRQKTPAE